MTGTEWAWVVVWIALVLVLVVVEVFTLDFIFLMLAIGAAGGLVAALLGAPWWADVVVAAAVSLLLLSLVRPRLLRLLGRGADPHRTNVDGLIGMPGKVAVAFTSTAPGQVRLANGETWSARIVGDALAPETPVDRTPPLGTHVVVTAIEGSTAVVRTTERTPS
ncbi:NfeD family protein [Curtobacterium sp. RRHDQ10]|uniref:NfeD family protein n=1 Tax=Curtobacterium phyllosphaerae TaxID=3413379 RepID=UPI003BEFBA90